MFLIWILELLQAIGLYLLWGGINRTIWWVLFGVLLFMFLGARAYRNSLSDGSEAMVVRFWRNARAMIFVIDILVVIGIYSYLIFF